MKFEAKKTDLKLELTTLEGEEIALDCNQNISANKAALIVKKMDDMAKKQTGENDPTLVVDLIGRQLSDIYGKKSKWWSDNFDISTLVEVKKYVLAQLSGIKKNGQS